MNNDQVITRLFEAFDTCASVSQLMHALHHIEANSDCYISLVFVTATPADAHDLTPQYVSVKHWVTGEFATKKLNRAMIAFAILHELTYSHRDLHMAFSEWMPTGGDRDYLIEVEANSDEPMEGPIDADGPCLSRVQ